MRSASLTISVDGIFSARYLGDDARHAIRSWRTSPPFEGLADRLPDGAEMHDDLFPRLI